MIAQGAINMKNKVFDFVNRCASTTTVTDKLMGKVVGKP